MMIPDRTAQTTVLRSGVAILAAALLGSFATVAVAPRRGATLFADLAIFGGYRCIEPRLSIDVPHAAFRLVSGDERKDVLRHRDARLFSAAVTARSQNKGLIDLLFGQTEPAIKSLRNPVDLSAAHYMRGLQTGSLNDFARALQALSGAPDSPATRFNRALVIEQLADTEAAAAEWRRYLAVDSSSEWAVEARYHLEVSRRPSMPEVWTTNKPRLLDAASRGDGPRVRELVLRHPLATRQLVQTELLPAWGAALSRHDATVATRSLDAARACVNVLAARGDHLLRDAIAEIDTAAPEQQTALAKAYMAYAEGHQALEKADHDRSLERNGAARTLAAGFAAFNAIVIDDMATALYRKYDYSGAERLIAEAHSRYGARADYIALSAHLDWLSGLIEFVRGDAGRTLRTYERALAAYRQLGELENEGAQEVNLAATLTYLGENERAGVHRRKALILAGQGEDPRRLYSILKNAADSALEEASPAAALVFQDRFVRVARATDEPLRIADALVARSAILSRAGRRAEALRDVAEVNRLAGTIVDAPSRNRLLADACTAEAFAQRDADPRSAVASLTRAIDLLWDQQAPMLMAQLLLERGRAHLKLGETHAAEADFRSGIEKLEHQRRLMSDADLRVTYFDRAERLFVELAVLLLRSGKPAEAFDLIERSRSRELLDRSSGRMMTPMSVADIRSHLPWNTLLVAHTVTEQELITWVISRDGVRAFEQNAGAGEIGRLLDAVLAGFDSAQLPERELRRLGALLIDRVAPSTGARIVFVPDQLLYGASFAALRTARGRYLIEDQTIMVAPSATLYVRNSERDRKLQRRGEPSLLAIASPQSPKQFDRLRPLTHAADEAREAAANYARHRVIVAPTPPETQILSIAGDYDALHFASHSVVDPRNPARSALLIGEDGRISAADIEHAALPHVRLVVLGGCNTGSGKSYRSEGVMSLARAFMAASVPTVIGTVANVEDDATKRLLTDFHDAYSSGLDAAAALRRAQLHMLYGGDPTDANPARWSPFEAIGGAYAPEREREEVARSWASH